MTALASISQRAAGLAQQIERRADHLRLAADAIGVLHAACRPRGGFRGFRDPAISARMAAATSIWPAMAAQGMDFRLERRGRAHDRIGGQRAVTTHGSLRIAPGVEQARQRAGGGELRAVDQRQALLRAQHDRREPGAAQRLAAGHASRPR